MSMDNRKARLLREYELMALRILFPGASSKRITRLYELAKAKGVPICRRPDRTDALENLMGSIVRHSGTHYEEVLRAGLAKDSARGLVQPMIREELAYLRGE